MIHHLARAVKAANLAYGLLSTLTMLALLVIGITKAVRKDK